MASDRVFHPLRLDVRPGVIAVHDGHLVEILNDARGGTVEVRDLATDAQTSVRVADLRGRPDLASDELDRRLTLLTERPASEQAEAVARVRSLEHALATCASRAEAVRQVATAHHVTPRTVCRWIARWRNAALPTSLLSERPGPPKGRWLLDAARERVITTVVQRSYLKQPRARPQDIYEEVCFRLAEAGLAPVARKTVAARLRALDPHLVLRRRYGAREAAAVLGTTPGRFEVPHALGVVQIDHTLVDVHVVDAVRREPVGRPWLTLAIDVCSRCVCGFHLALDPPSQLSVALCLTHAVLPKDAWLAERGVECAWDVFGLMQTLHADNGKDLRAEGLTSGCAEYGISLQHRPIGAPRYGGHIERLLGTMMGRVHLLPGTTYANLTERGDYPSERAAVLTLRELERILTLEICERYHRSVHRSLGTTPALAWEAEVAKGMARSLPADPRRFLLSFLPIERRSLQRNGVYVHNIRYWSDVLPTLARPGEPVTVRIDPRNLAVVYVCGPQGRYYDVPYADLRDPPVALWEIQAASKALHRSGRARPREHELFKAVLAQREIVTTATRTTKRIRRANERRRLGEGVPAPASPGAPAPINYTVDPAVLATETWSDP